MTWFVGALLFFAILMSWGIEIALFRQGRNYPVAAIVSLSIFMPVSIMFIVSDMNPLAPLIVVALDVIALWNWWKRRPPRKRRLKRSMSRVRDLGHRLVTVPQ